MPDPTPDRPPGARWQVPGARLFRSGRPLPLWMIFPLIFAALYLAHWSVLSLPYYWDEAGYYIPAAWDFFRTGSLIPISTLTNAHPPLPSVYLALWWWASGFTPEVTREAVLIVAAFGLTAVWRLSLQLTRSAPAAFSTLLLTALYPIWFAQSTLAHADIFAAAATLWALVYALPAPIPGKPARIWPAAVWFSLAVLAKETALATPLLLALISIVEGARLSGTARRRSFSAAAWYLACILPLALWYAYHRAKTGFLFGNPEFLRYNATSTLSPLRILAAFGHRILHLTGNMNLFVPVLCLLAALMLDPILQRDGQPRPGIPRQTLIRIGILILGNALAFSLLGGALLTRYLLPVYPLVLVVCVSVFRTRVRWWPALVALSAAAFVAALFLAPPYGFAPEDNLTYARVIRLHQAAIAELAKSYPGATVLSAWPGTDELTKPELGYVTTPFSVYRLEDFTTPQILRAQQDPEGYSAALVFSTKEDPPPLPFHLNSASMEEQYFGLHHDLGPEEIAARLQGQIVFKQRDGLDWVAVIRFRRSIEARLIPLSPKP